MAGQTGNGERNYLDRKGGIPCAGEGKMEFSTSRSKKLVTASCLVMLFFAVFNSCSGGGSVIEDQALGFPKTPESATTTSVSREPDSPTVISSAVSGAVTPTGILLASPGDIASKETKRPTPTPLASLTASVAVNNYNFSPSSVTIRLGGKVAWSFQGGTHTATGSGFNSGTKMTGQSFEHTFNSAGTYGYVCSFHGSMTGTVTVQ